MLRPLVLLCATAVALVPAVRAADPQAPAQPPAAQPAANAQAQPPVIINYPSAAFQQAPAGTAPQPDAKNLPTVTNLPPAARPGDRQANAPTTRGYTLVVPTEGAVLPTSYLAPYAGPLPGPYDYSIGAIYGPSFGYGYTLPAYDYALPSYPFGYVPPIYALGYTTAYAFWAEPRPIPSAVVSPAGRLSYMGNPGVVWGSGAFYHR